MRASTSPLSPRGNEWIANVGQGLTAAGSSQGTATAIPLGQDCSVLGSGAQNAAYSLAAGKTGYFTCIGQNRFTVNP